MTHSTRVVASAMVLMPFDGSPQALRTFPIARTIARMLEGSLHLALTAEKRERLPLPAEQSPRTTLHELLGDLALGTVRLASFNPDAMIVLPTYGGSQPESGLGPVPEEILRLAECPVLLVPPGIDWSAWRPTRILVPQDGTADAAKSLCPATRLAEASGAEVVIVHVSPDRPSVAPKPGTMEFPAYMDQPQHEWPSWVAGFLERVRHLCGMTALTALRFQWACGDPGWEIVELARRKHVDLITVSWGRCSDPGRALVIRKVLRDSPCPVLVLPCTPL